MNSNEQFERDFERFVGEDNSPVVALYRKLPQPEPDAQLDAAVLAMARRAVTKTAQAPSRRQRWLPVLASAATLVLAAGVAIRMRVHTDVAPQTIPASARNAGAATTSAMPPTQPSVANAPIASPAPAPQVMQAPVAAEQAAPPPLLSPPSKMMKEVVSPRAERAASKTEPSAADGSQMSARQPLPPTPPPAAPAMRQSSSDALATGRMEKEQDKPAASAGARAKSAESLRDSNELLRNSRLYPESWIAEIRQLIQAGHDRKARENIDYFRKKYPDYRLPADLDKLAGPSQ